MSEKAVKANRVTLTPLVRRYIRNVARGHIVDMTERQIFRHDDRRDAIWDRMTKREQADANRLVMVAFGPFC